MNFQLENKNVYASDAGQGIDQNKETIVFLHGSGLSHIVWSLTEQFFSNNNFNVLSIDLPGHGNSDGPCLDSIEKIAIFSILSKQGPSELPCPGKSIDSTLKLLFEKNCSVRDQTICERPLPWRNTIVSLFWSIPCPASDA